MSLASRSAPVDQRRLINESETRPKDAPELAADNVFHLELGGSAMAKDLTVDLGEDRPGRLAAACEALGSAKVNIDGLCEAGGQLHLLVASPAKAKKAIEKAGFRVTGEHDVIVRKVVNRPGQGGRVLRALAGADVNVEFAYMATGTRLVVGVNDLSKARRVLGKHPFIKRSRS